MSNKELYIRDDFGPLDAYKQILHPKVLMALVRGSLKYKDAWLKHMHPDMSTVENVKHVIDIHAQTRILQALERLDYGDFDGFLEYMASAVGYLANATLKAKYLLDKEEENNA